MPAPGSLESLSSDQSDPLVSLAYVLVTPARNEVGLIEGTIRAVLSQSVLPKKWVIVSDGSTDKTDEIVGKYAAENPWIELLRLPERQDRQFAAKARAFNAGYKRLSDLEFDVIGNLDADITFEPSYLAFLLDRFRENPRLGVAGTPFVEGEDRGSHSYAHRFAQLEHVSGACQMFRRACFEEVGGYVPVKGGAIDWIAVTTARMKGWETRTFAEKICFHHRQLGTGNGRPWLVRFRYGQKAYYVGGHPLWALLRGLFQMREKPWIIGGFLFECGYWWSFLTRMQRPVSQELIAFHRGEQMRRLRRLPGLRGKA
jgi:glycosyltransferase involved in cell wall biosynthesis